MRFLKNICSKKRREENEIITKLDKLTDLTEQLKRETHRHIDYTYRDLMVVLENKLNFVKNHGITLKTDFPVAFESIDHKAPRGTLHDNTRYPRFIKKCETLFPEKETISFLDLGCSGGGMVLDAILRNHIGIGLEGSDTSYVAQRAEWRLLRNNLFTCDITKPFTLNDSDGNTHKFDIIAAWEVLEHLEEKSLTQFFANLTNHMHENSYFIATIADWDDIDEKTGINWHITVKPFEWWKNMFEQNGFKMVENKLSFSDYPRGGLIRLFIIWIPMKACLRKVLKILILKSFCKKFNPKKV